MTAVRRKDDTENLTGTFERTYLPFRSQVPNCYRTIAAVADLIPDGESLAVGSEVHAKYVRLGSLDGVAVSVYEIPEIAPFKATLCDRQRFQSRDCVRNVVSVYEVLSTVDA